MKKEKIRRQDILDYHEGKRPGKIEVIPSKPSNSQRDLSIAYSPGVALPCTEIAADENNAYKYTAKGNLVAVITNGTAVSQTVIGTTLDLVGTGDNFIFGTNTSIYTTLTVIGLDSGARVQIPVEITRNSTT